MQPTFIASATHRFAPPENWDEKANGPCGHLFVRCDMSGPNNLVEVCSCWKPLPEELDKLLAGGVIEVRLCVPNQPVMAVGVVDALPDVVAREMGYDEHGPSQPA